MSFSLSDLAAAVRLYLNEQGANRTPIRVKIYTVEDREPFAVNLPTAQTQHPETSTQEDEHGLSLPRPIQDILRTLREVDRPLSRTRLLEEMGRRGMDWSDRTVARYLAELMADGTIENPETARPRGYRIVT
jgi:hypothetical protein